jgi:hypothetical protein
MAQGVLAIAALAYSILTFRKSRHDSHYTELDSMYFEILRIALEKPHLIDPAASRSGDQALEYEAYAFMVWNFLEAIYDRCEHNNRLCCTWYPVIDTENRLHRAWFDRKTNEHRFKPAFRAFVRSDGFIRP